MLEQVAKTYGKKGKSRWIKEAIAMLVAEDVGLSTVGLGEDFETHDQSDVVLLDEEAFDHLLAAMTTVRRQDPLYEGVQSAVIRAAIRLRINSEI